MWRATCHGRQSKVGRLRRRRRKRKFGIWGGKKWLEKEKEKEMQGNVAKELLGFPPNSRPTPSQVKAAYKRKAWESHPDRFPAHEKVCAESKFKLISEAYSFLQAGTWQDRSVPVYTRVVRTGVPRVYGRSSSGYVKAPFILLIFGTLGLGGFNVARAYQRQRDAYPSHNPFLP